MRDTGGLLIVLGVGLIVFCFLVPTSTHVGYSSYSPYALNLPSDVSNLHGMHTQMALLVGGIGSIISGAIFIGAAAIVSALDHLRAAQSKIATFPVSTPIVAEPTPAIENKPDQTPEVRAESPEPGDSFVFREEVYKGSSSLAAGIIVVTMILITATAIFYYATQTSRAPDNGNATSNTVSENSASTTSAPTKSR